MCINCNENVSNKVFKISERGWGSIFDLDKIEIPLCKNCIKKLNVQNKWFKNKRNKNGFYDYETEVEELINKIGLDKVFLTNICSSSIIALQ